MVKAKSNEELRFCNPSSLTRHPHKTYPIILIWLVPVPLARSARPITSLPSVLFKLQFVLRIPSAFGSPRWWSAWLSPRVKSSSEYNESFRCARVMRQGAIVGFAENDPPSNTSASLSYCWSVFPSVRPRWQLWKTIGQTTVERSV